MDGLLIVDKPEGPTSADVVRKVKRALQSKTGHLGTLDPFATGVLPVCLGEATKVAQFLSIADKEYEGTIRIGSATDSGDLTGRVSERDPAPPAIGGFDLGAIAARFLGDRLQTPPMYSAIKQDGTPLYRLARQGLTVERAARAIRIDALTLSPVADDLLGFRVACSKGTYVRVLAEEIAAALGTCGHLHTLRRTVFGRFKIAAAVSLHDVLNATLPPPLIGVREALEDLREFALAPGEEVRARHGDQAILLRWPLSGADEAAKLIAADGTLVAVITPTAARRWQYARVFRN